MLYVNESPWKPDNNDSNQLAQLFKSIRVHLCMCMTALEYEEGSTLVCSYLCVNKEMLKEMHVLYM